MNSKFLPILATCIGGCLIGLAPIFVRFSEIGPSFTGFYRFVFATTLILIYGLISGKLKFLKFRDLLIVAIPGLCFGIDITFWHSSITMTSVANATLFINTAPLYVCLFALIIFKERLNFLFLVALVLSFSGILIMTTSASSFSGDFYSLGNFLALLGAFFYAGYLLSVNKLSDRYDIFNLIFYSSLFACIPLGMGSLLELDRPFPSSYLGWSNFLGQAIFVQIMGQGLVIYGLSKIKPQISSLLLLFQPVTATILGVYFFSETLLLGQFIGVIILLIGIYFAGLSERLNRGNQ